MLTPSQTQEIADALKQLVPSNHRFFFAAFPVRGQSSSSASTVLDNINDKTELVACLRRIVHHYDPQS